MKSSFSSLYSPWRSFESPSIICAYSGSLSSSSSTKNPRDLRFPSEFYIFLCSPLIPHPVSDLVDCKRFALESWPFKFPSDLSFLPIMSSPSSSTSSGLSIEARLDALETEMGRLRRRIDRQDQQIVSNSQATDQSWNLLSDDIRKIREVVTASAENVDDLKDEVQVSFKDAASTHGNMGKRICELEKQVSNLIAKMNK